MTDDKALRRLAKQALDGVHNCLTKWGDSPANAARWLREWKNAHYAQLIKAGCAEPRRFDPWAFK